MSDFFSSAAGSSSAVALVLAVLLLLGRIIAGQNVSITSRAKSDGDQILKMIETIATLQQRVEQLEAAGAAKDARIAAQDARIAALEAEKAAKDARVAELERRLSLMGEAGS